MSDRESKSRFFLFPDREHDVAQGPWPGQHCTATSNDGIHSEDDSLLSLHTQYHALTTQHGGRCIIYHRLVTALLSHSHTSQCQMCNKHGKHWICQRGVNLTSPCSLCKVNQEQTIRSGQHTYKIVDSLWKWLSAPSSGTGQCTQSMFSLPPESSPVLGTRPCCSSLEA